MVVCVQLGTYIINRQNRHLAEKGRGEGTGGGRRTERERVREIEGVIYIIYMERGNLPLITGLLEVRHRQGQAVYIYVYDYDEVRSCACCVSVALF